MSRMPGTGWQLWTTTPGSRCCGGQHHRDRVGAGEPAQRRRLVGDAVLRADDGRAGRRVRATRSASAASVWCDFTASSDDGVVGPGDLGRGVGGAVRGRRAGPPRCRAPARRARIRARCSPRATSVTSWPARCSRAADDAADGAAPYEHVASSQQLRAGCAARPRRRACRRRRCSRTHADDRERLVVGDHADDRQHDAGDQVDHVRAQDGRGPWRPRAGAWQFGHAPSLHQTVVETGHGARRAGGGGVAGRHRADAERTPARVRRRQRGQRRRGPGPARPADPAGDQLRGRPPRRDDRRPPRAGRGDAGLRPGRRRAHLDRPRPRSGRRARRSTPSTSTGGCCRCPTTRTRWSRTPARSARCSRPVPTTCWRC